MNENQTSSTSHVVEAWKCPKCGANNYFNPNICTSCNYSKIPPIQVLPPKSRQNWEKISLVLIGLFLLLQIGYAVTMFLGIGMTLLYQIDGVFYETALKYPDMILYSHFATAGICLVMAGLNGFDLFRCIQNKDNLTGALHRSAFMQCIAVWTFPAVNILTDMVVTSIKKNGVNLRSFSAYDLFDFGLTVIVPLVITAIGLIVIYVNSRLAPEDNLDDEE